MGYSAEQAEIGLREANGDLEIAVDFLNNEVPFISPEKLKKVSQEAFA